MANGSNTAETVEDSGPPEIMELLLRGFQASRALMQHRMCERGFPNTGFAQVRLLRAVEPGGTRAAVLAARTGTTRQFTGRAVGDLERRGLVEVAPDPNDRRASVVRLTETGERFCLNATEVKGELDAQLAERFGKAQVERLAAMLQTLIDEAGEVRAAGDGLEPAE